MVVNGRYAAMAVPRGADVEPARATPQRCFCCRLEGPCDCGSEPCWECGACPTHCECPDGFVTCECRRIGDVDDASGCPVHGRGSANIS